MIGEIYTGLKCAVVDEAEVLRVLRLKNSSKVLWRFNECRLLMISSLKSCNVASLFPFAFNTLSNTVDLKRAKNSVVNERCETRSNTLEQTLREEDTVRESRSRRTLTGWCAMRTVIVSSEGAFSNVYTRLSFGRCIICFPQNTK